MPTQNPTVIYVDDHHVLTGYNRTAFEEEGFNFLHCPRVHEFLKLLEKDLAGDTVIICCVTMPHGPELDYIKTQNGLQTGVQLNKKIRERHPSVPVILLATADPVKTIKDLIGNDPHTVVYDRVEFVPSKALSEVRQLLRTT